MINDEEGAEEPQPVAPQPPRAIEKTPMFTAMNAARYQRQMLIKEIESTHPKLLCYVAGNKAPVDRIDTLGFVDMLHNVNPGDPIDLLLHTPGGDVDAAEKLIGLVRSATGEEGQIRVILTYLNAYEAARNALREAPDDLAARLTFEKFDPTIVRKFQSVRDRARSFAENLLKRRGKNFSKIASELMDISKYQSHGQMIGWETANEMGLTIMYMRSIDPVWRKYWALYCHLRLAIRSKERIFESNYVSLLL